MTDPTNDKDVPAEPTSANPTSEAEQTNRSTAPVRPSPPDEVYERRAVRRGCFSIIFGAVLGGMVGMALTLAILSWLNNGLLTYNQADVMLRHQLDGEIATRQAILDAQATTMSDISTQQAVIATDMAQTLMEVEQMAGTAEAEVAGMRVTAVYLETRIASAGNAADTLDMFLVGLNDLLADMATPTPDGNE
jgi:hypothetical protein